MSLGQSLRAYQEVERQAGRDAWFFLVTIKTNSGAVLIRLTTDNSNTSSGGELYLSRFFDLVLMDQSPDEPPSAALSMDAVDRTIEGALDQLDDQPKVDILIVLSSDPETIVKSSFDLRLVSYSLTLPTVTAVLEGPDFFNQQSPGPNMDPLETPALFT